MNRAQSALLFQPLTKAVFPSSSFFLAILTWLCRLRDMWLLCSDSYIRSTVTAVIQFLFFCPAEQCDTKWFDLGGDVIPTVSKVQKLHYMGRPGFTKYYFLL